MKFAAAILAGSLMIAPSWANEDKPEPATPNEVLGNPPAELGYLITCIASEMSLAHMRIQIAASIAALSPDQTPQLKLLIDSYKALAEDSDERVKTYTDVINTILAPQIINDHKVSKEEFAEKTEALLKRSLVSVMVALGNPNRSLEDQTQLETLLMEQSRGCENLAEKIKMRHSL